MRALVLLLAACGSSQSPIGDDDVSPDAIPSVDTPASVSCDGKTAQPLDATWTIGNRTAKVHVPSSYDPSKATPIVIDVHGRTQNAAGEMALDHSIAKSDAEGFIAIYPESATSPTSWNSGTCCDPASTNNLDDTGFLSA
jgi:poly(3-hydroxybutyrate) depolymerase